jgi:hypothetical protein
MSRSSRDDTPTSRRNTWLLDNVTTTDDTPTIAYQVPLLPVGSVFGKYRAIAALPDKTKMIAFDAIVGFRRTVAGDVIRLSAPMINRITDWSGVKPDIDIVANVGTETMDLVLTGRPATTINWTVEGESLQSPP